MKPLLLWQPLSNTEPCIKLRFFLCFWSLFSTDHGAQKSWVGGDLAFVAASRS